MATTRGDDGSMWQWAPELEEDGAIVSTLGYTAQGLDESLGAIVGVSPKHAGGYLVLDADGWLESGRALVPAGAVRGVDHTMRTVEVGLKRKDLVKAPPFQDDCDRDAYRRSSDEHFAERLEKRNG